MIDCENSNPLSPFTNPTLRALRVFVVILKIKFSAEFKQNETKPKLFILFRLRIPAFVRLIVVMILDLHFYRIATCSRN